LEDQVADHAHSFVPSVDISPYVTGGDDAARAHVAKQMDDACRTVGFVQILGHGIPDAVIDGLAGAMDAFFDQPLEVKQGYRCPHRSTGAIARPRRKR
jgi:isopenicillin N synthase-like dioxygenase